MSSSQLHKFPTAPIGHYPTPLEELKHLSKEIAGPRIWVKRDDLTGVAMGGSKTRALGTLLGQALAEGADTVITCGPTTSNHARLTTAAANKLGLDTILVLRKLAEGVAADGGYQGNMLLNHVLGARIVYADASSLAGLDPVMQEVAADLVAQGKKPFIIPGGGYSPFGAIGYLGLVEELRNQAAANGIEIDAVICASGSGCIQSGLHLGNVFHGTRFPIIGLTINRSVEELWPRIEHDVAVAAEMLGLATPEGLPIEVLDDYIGPAYAQPSAPAMEAIERLAKLEGLLLDPCYTGKAMAGVIDLAHNRFKPGQNIVFIHTGGSPGIFTYSEELSTVRSGAQAAAVN
ncbi:D-cysteine desulfhydrase family protein (plasmid) [Cupriavidus basilensis]